MRVMTKEEALQKSNELGNFFLLIFHMSVLVWGSVLIKECPQNFSINKRQEMLQSIIKIKIKTVSKFSAIVNSALVAIRSVRR